MIQFGTQIKKSIYIFQTRNAKKNNLKRIDQYSCYFPLISWQFNLHMYIK